MKKKAPQKKAKKAAPKKANQKRPVEVKISVQHRNLPAVVPTETDLTQPISEGKKLTIPKTWLSDKQILRLVERTPSAQVYQRPGKGGKKWDYVTVSYVQRVLDYTFGFNWDFEIVEHGKEKDHVWVLGKLTVKNPEGTRSITKTQFGRSEVKYVTEQQGDKRVKTDAYLDYGNDLKAASSDALKKCASMLGIARDIYGKTDYKAESGRDPRPTPPAPAPAQTRVVPDNSQTPPEEILCHGARTKVGCPYSAELSQQARDYSVRLYGRPLCASCQKEMPPVKKS